MSAFEAGLVVGFGGRCDLWGVVAFPPRAQRQFDGRGLAGQHDRLARLEVADGGGGADRFPPGPDGGAAAGVDAVGGHFVVAERFGEFFGVGAPFAAADHHPHSGRRPDRIAQFPAVPAAQQRAALDRHLRRDPPPSGVGQHAVPGRELAGVERFVGPEVQQRIQAAPGGGDGLLAGLPQDVGDHDGHDLLRAGHVHLVGQQIHRPLSLPQPVADGNDWDGR